MNLWITFWTFVLLISVLIFAGVAVVVTIGGAREIRDLLFRTHRDKPNDDSLN